MLASGARMTLDADYIALRARVAETHPAMLPLYDAERETVIETMRAVAAEHAPRPPAPPAPQAPVEEDPFSTSTPESSSAALARRIAEDALTGPRPLEPEADPYGLREVSYAANRNDGERTHALTLLAKRYGVDLPTFEAAVLLILRPEGEEASSYRGLTTLQSREPGSNHDWYRDGVLTALAGTIGEAPGAYGRDFAVAALRMLDLNSRFRSRDSLIPFEKLPDGYRRALTRIHPRSATMVQVEPGNPVWAIEAWTALGHMRRLVKRRLAEDERYRYQYPYTPEELEAAERWYAANVEPNVPSGTLMFRGVHGNAISGNEADSVHRMACRARWFLPRYGSQAGDRDLPFPDVRKADYGANFTIGDLLLDDLGWFSTYAELPGGFLVSTSREEKIEALMLAGYRFRPRSTTPSNPYDGPLSEERIYGWLRRMSDRTYGDNPWSIKIEPTRVVLVFRNHPNDPDPFQHVIQSPGKGQRAALAAIGNDAALWSAFVRYKLNQNKSSFAHIFASILNDWRHWKNRGAPPAPAAPPAPQVPAPAPTPPVPQAPAAALPPLPPLVDVETGLTDYGRSTSKEAPRNVYAYKLAGAEQSPTAKAAMLEQGWTILDTRAGGSYTHAIPPGGVKLPTQRGTLGAYSSNVTFITIRAKAPRLGAFERWADAVHAYYSASPTEKAQVVRVSPTILWTYVPARVERSTLVINNEQSSDVRYRDASLTLHTGSGVMMREWRNPENPEPPPAHFKYPRTSVRAVFYPDRIPGGQAEGMTPGAFDPDRLAEGTKHELEHTTDEDIAREIAMDHLTEDPDYYRKGAGASGAGGAGAGHAPARISGARTEGSRAYQSAVYASRAAGSRDRLREATSRLFGRDLSGGAEWSTEGAWRVAPGRYLVRVDDLWYVVARQADGQGGYIDTDLTPPLAWADAVRAARGAARATPRG